MPALEGRPRELLEAKNLAHIAVPRRDGTIMTAVIWVHVDEDGRPFVNSAEGRAWPKNLRREGRMTISVSNSENPYEWVSIVASLVGDTQDGADDDINLLTKKYLDQDIYPFREEGEVRVTFTLEPERVSYLAP